FVAIGSAVTVADVHAENQPQVRLRREAAEVGDLVGDERLPAALGNARVAPLPDKVRGCPLDLTGHGEPYPITRSNVRGRAPLGPRHRLLVLVCPSPDRVLVRVPLGFERSVQADAVELADVPAAVDLVDAAVATGVGQHQIFRRYAVDASEPAPSVHKPLGWQARWTHHDHVRHALAALGHLPRLDLAEVDDLRHRTGE